MKPLECVAPRRHLGDVRLRLKRRQRPALVNHEEHVPPRRVLHDDEHGARGLEQLMDTMNGCLDTDFMILSLNHVRRLVNLQNLSLVITFTATAALPGGALLLALRLDQHPRASPRAVHLSPRLVHRTREPDAQLLREREPSQHSLAGVLLAEPDELRTASTGSCEPPGTTSSPPPSSPTPRRTSRPAARRATAGARRGERRGVQVGRGFGIRGEGSTRVVALGPRTWTVAAETFPS